MEAKLITLITDFGHKDPFVGIMKGVIFGINPNASIIDLSHGIPPQDLMAAALVLRYATPFFPSGTIHIAVVDPGVGSKRRPLLIEGKRCQEPFQLVNEGETLDPIPNTVVNPSSADGTIYKVAVWESRSPPDLKMKARLERGRDFLFLLDG